MKWSILIITLLVGNYYASAQVTDNDIVNSTLGKNIFSLNKTLDSLGVWYHLHFDMDKAVKGSRDLKKFYSISDSKGSVKVYSFKTDEKNFIDEIVINFRHDSRQQVEDAMKIKNQTAFHVGMYSTDMIFKRK